MLLQDDHDDDNNGNDDDAGDDDDVGMAIMVIGSDDWDPPQARSSNQSFGSSPRETPLRGARNKILDGANLVISISLSLWNIFFLLAEFDVIINVSALTGLAHNLQISN